MSDFEYSGDCTGIGSYHFVDLLVPQGTFWYEVGGTGFYYKCGTGTVSGAATVTLDNGFYGILIQPPGAGYPGVGDEIPTFPPSRALWAIPPLSATINFSGVEECEDCT
jgi:hypothetical protein